MSKAYFYRVYVQYKNSDEIFSDCITTATGLKDAKEFCTGKLTGSSYDDGSLPMFVKAERISKEQAKKESYGNVLWIRHDDMYKFLD